MIDFNLGMDSTATGLKGQYFFWTFSPAIEIEISCLSQDDLFMNSEKRLTTTLSLRSTSRTAESLVHMEYVDVDGRENRTYSSV